MVSVERKKEKTGTNWPTIIIEVKMSYDLVMNSQVDDGQLIVQKKKCFKVSKIHFENFFVRERWCDSPTHLLDETKNLQNK